MQHGWQAEDRGGAVAVPVCSGRRTRGPPGRDGAHAAVHRQGGRSVSVSEDRKETRVIVVEYFNNKYAG